MFGVHRPAPATQRHTQPAPITPTTWPTFPLVPQSRNLRSQLVPSPLTSALSNRSRCICVWMYRSDVSGAMFLPSREPPHLLQLRQIGNIVSPHKRQTDRSGLCLTTAVPRARSASPSLHSRNSRLAEGAVPRTNNTLGQRHPIPRLSTFLLPVFLVWGNGRRTAPPLVYKLTF